MQDETKAEEFYKDVVIVGNGPSSIVLSYMLAGNWPYYMGESHPSDEMLNARLHHSVGTQTCDCEVVQHCRGVRCCKNNKKGGGGCGGQQVKCSLARCTRDTLEHLASGLEGRTGGRPLSLLMDQLQHPCVDLGMDVPPLVTWRSANLEPDHQIIEHMVLGKGPPGGAWHSLDPEVLTISLSRWMSLPGLDLRQWEQLKETELPGEQETIEKIGGCCRAVTRVTIGTVSQYYKDYVQRQGLQSFFKCGVTVTSVRPTLRWENGKKYKWQVEGSDNVSGKRFRYFCKKVVLASGTTDSRNRLGIPGEMTHNAWVTHDLSDLERKLDGITKTRATAPALVVGAGLTAADAVMAARFRGIPVLHVFRDGIAEEKLSSRFKASGNAEKLQYLPDSIYPEYHKVFEMMSDGGKNYPLYKALPGHSLVDIKAQGSGGTDKLVLLNTPDNRVRAVKVSVVAILIGSKPDLTYLKENGLGLGEFPDREIDSKSNPIVVDDLTHEVLNSDQDGCYALGPLVGENFVRFILGGAFGAFNHILDTL